MAPILPALSGLGDVPPESPPPMIRPFPQGCLQKSAGVCDVTEREAYHAAFGRPLHAARSEDPGDEPCDSTFFLEAAPGVGAGGRRVRIRSDNGC